MLLITHIRVHNYKLIAIIIKFILSLSLLITRNLFYFNYRAYFRKLTPSWDRPAPQD